MGATRCADTHERRPEPQCGAPANPHGPCVRPGQHPAGPSVPAWHLAPRLPGTHGTLGRGEAGRVREGGRELSLMFSQLFCQPKTFQIRRAANTFKRTEHGVRADVSEHVPPTLQWAGPREPRQEGRVPQAGAPARDPRTSGPTQTLGGRPGGAGLGPLVWIQEAPGTLECHDSACGTGGGVKASDGRAGDPRATDSARGRGATTPRS